MHTLRTQQGASIRIILDALLALSNSLQNAKHVWQQAHWHTSTAIEHSTAYGDMSFERGASGLVFLATGLICLMYDIINAYRESVIMGENQINVTAGACGSFWDSATQYTSASSDEQFVEEVAYVMVTLHRTGN